MTGGQNTAPTGSVEVYLPSSSRLCLLPSLARPVVEHSQEGGLLCGGSGDSGACYQLEGGSWSRTIGLTGTRRAHSSWARRDGGVMLMGGVSTATSTEILRRGVSTPGFTLKYKTS